MTPFTFAMMCIAWFAAGNVFQIVLRDGVSGAAGLAVGAVAVIIVGATIYWGAK